MTHKILPAFVLLPVLALAGCHSIPEDTKDLLAKPINCYTAEQDIAALQEAIPSNASRVKAGVRSVLPVGIVTGVATRDYKDRVSVASGHLEDDLTKKILAIKNTCWSGNGNIPE